MNGYPPGVTGNEWQITGPLEEWSQWVGCPVCEREAKMDCWWHPDTGAWATCRDCRNEIELPDPREPDPDLEYDAWRERQWEDDNA